MEVTGLQVRYGQIHSKTRNLIFGARREAGRSLIPAPDKGNAFNISVIVYDAKHKSLVLEQVTSEQLKAHLTGVVDGEVVRYEMPIIAALNFVMTGVPSGGVTRSLALEWGRASGITYERATHR